MKNIISMTDFVLEQISKSTIEGLIAVYKDNLRIQLTRTAIKQLRVAKQ